MNKKLVTVKNVAAVAIGSALMFVLMRFAAIPTFAPNTNVNLGIAILSVFAAIFGPVVGFLIGFIGHTLTDLTLYSHIWWTWVIGSALFGLGVGVFFKLYKIEQGEFGIRQMVFFNGVQILMNLLIWVGVAPTFNILVNSESSDKVYLQGFVAASINIAVVLILGTLLAFVYSKTRTKAGSLKTE